MLQHSCNSEIETIFTDVYNVIKDFLEPMKRTLEDGLR